MIPHPCGNIVYSKNFYIHGMLLALVKMSRPVNIVIAMVTLVIGYYLLSALPTTTGGIEWLPLVLQALGFAFAIAFANIQNDIWDLDSDRLNRPERPLVSGKVSVAAARRAWIILLVLTIAVGLADSLMTKTNFTACIFFVLLSALLVAYNKWLKHIPLLKNMTVAFLCTTPLLYALMDYLILSNLILPENDYAQEHIWAIIPAIPFAFLLTTAREIYKDLEDETGDLKAGIMTFPLIAGSATARKLAGAIILFTWISLPLPVFYMDKVFGHNYPPLFLIITGLTLTPTFAVILFSAHRNNYRRAQSLTKAAMFLGLIALIICVSIKSIN